MADGDRAGDPGPMRTLRSLDSRWWLCLVPALAFIVLASRLRAGVLFEFDRPILLAAHGIAGADLDRVAWWLARLGYAFGVIPFDVLLAVVLAVRHRFRDAGFVIAALGGSLLLDEVLKVVFARPRPTLWLPTETQHTFGFPSGHAMADATLVVVVTALAWRGRWRWPILLVLTVFALLVGASRVYNGVHYPSDVLAGWCAGVTWAMAMHLLVFPRPRAGATWPRAST